jgi:hypothetical protein
VKEVSDQSDVDIIESPFLLFVEAELVQKFLCRVFMFSITGIDERWFHNTVSLSVSSYGVLQPAADSLEAASDDENGVRAVTAKHLECVRVALLLVERRELRFEVVQFYGMKARRIAKGFFGTSRVLEKDQVDSNIVGVYLEARYVFSVCNGVLELSGFIVKIDLLLRRKIVDYANTSALKIPPTHDAPLRVRHKCFSLSIPLAVV